jgi:thiol-disulfide isomerase/thioredoxin
VIPEPPKADRRRTLLPWAALIAVTVIALTIAAAFTGDPEPVVAGGGDTVAAEGDAVPTQGSLTAGLATDEPALDFGVEGLDGSAFRLSDHLANDGRPVFLNLWASWCPPCREEMPAIDAVAANHPEIMFIGVAVEDDPVEAEKFGEEIGVDYLLAVDETGQVNAHYPALGLPSTFLISPEGRIVAKLFGGASEATFEEFLGFLDG